LGGGVPTSKGKGREWEKGRKGMARGKGREGEGVKGKGRKEGEGREGRAGNGGKGKDDLNPALFLGPVQGGFATPITP